jgi:alkane 1-monooxygenase
MIRETLRYFLGFFLPFFVFLDLHFSLAGYWLGPILAFVLVPILEQLLPRSVSNASEKFEHYFVFDVLLYLNLPIVFGVLIVGLNQFLNLQGSWWLSLGCIVSTGLVLGVNGINVAHELGHRSNIWSKGAAWLLLWPNLYMHFFIEHNLGHHRYVSTKKDPATARLNEHLYAFWIRSMWGSWISAWTIESDLLSRKNKGFWTAYNRMIWFTLSYLLYGVLLFNFGGLPALFFGILAGFIGILLLETVNYIEHYGLLRKTTASGHVETVKPWHSWNSDHRLGRAILYDLTRHSDHHFKSNRPYQMLRHRPEAPALPFGYPGSMLISMVPPLWFRIMNPRAIKWAELPKQHVNANLA